MVKVLFQNKRNWASYKGLVRKSEKMHLSQNVSKIWDVNSRNGTSCTAMYLSFTYISKHGNNTFPGS